MSNFISRLFNRKESEVSKVLVQGAGQAVWSDRDYRSFAKEGYQMNVVAYQCINRVAEAVASVPWLIVNGEGEQIERHPIADLLARPNPWQSHSDYVQSHISYLALAGNAYAEAVTVRGDVVKELYTHRPDRMKIVPGSFGGAQAYIYKMENSAEVRWDMDDPSVGKGPIRHFKLFNPINDWYGQSPIEAAAFGVDQHNEAMQWMQSLLQNRAQPSGALISEERLTPEQHQRVKAEIEKNYSGSKNAGRPMVFGGKVKWQEMSFSPSDMGVGDTKNSAARDICLAFGVPPMLMGIPGDNTYSNYKEARLAFWEDTVIPLTSYIIQEFNHWLLEGDEAQIVPDYDQVPAIVEKRQALWEMANESDDITLNESRAMKGYPPFEDERGEQLMSDVRSRPNKEPGPLEDGTKALWELAYGKTA